MSLELHKTVCIWCCQTTGIHLDPNDPTTEEREPVGWLKEDEQRWENGRILCPHRSGQLLFDTAHKHCPHHDAHESISAGVMAGLNERPET